MNKNTTLNFKNIITNKSFFFIRFFNQHNHTTIISIFAIDMFSKIDIYLCSFFLLVLIFNLNLNFVFRTEINIRLQKIFFFIKK